MSGAGNSADHAAIGAATGARWGAMVFGATFVIMLAARLLGPSDIHHQSQPKTVSYTIDMLVHGRWVLPVERGALPATKPPLYNWVAAPFVRVMGFDSELAHKMPSVLALIACTLAFAWLGERVLGRGVGFLAATMLLTTYAMFKLGFLARPDMLLTLWLTLAWMAATKVVMGVSRQQDDRVQSAAGSRQPVAGETSDLETSLITQPAARSAHHGFLVLFWLAVALAWLTKGPPALVAMVFPLLIARPIAGRLNAVHAFRWWWGVPLILAPFVAWLVAVYTIDPDHLVRTLWEDELYGRITGTQGEAPEQGPMAWITTSLYMPAYFLLRAAPWSALTLVAMLLLWRRDRRQGGITPAPRTWRALGGRGAWLHAAAVWIVLIVVTFSLSAGKRADYIAAAYPPAMLLASWAWLRLAHRLMRSELLWRLVPTSAAALTLSLLVVANALEWGAPVKGVGRAYGEFISAARRTIEAQPLPLIVTSTGGSHVQAFFGLSEPETAQSLNKSLRAHERFWLIAGDRPRTAQGEGLDVPSFAARRGAQATLVLRSIELPRTADWPGGLTLWRVERR